MKELFWKFRYARHLKKELHIPMRQALDNANAMLENINYDLDECPVNMADEELVLTLSNRQREDLC